jgi:hypothetical protein
MKTFIRQRHQLIARLLENFDEDYFTKHNILFGGGTRIVLEAAEFRESVDIDFLCPSVDAYRAVRTAVASDSFGRLAKGRLDLLREIRADRYGVRALVQIEDVQVKVEFIATDNYDLKKTQLDGISVPAISRESCFATKLLAHADRYAEPSKKDLLDLLAMRHYWGQVPAAAWDEARRHYGDIPFRKLVEALEQITQDPAAFVNNPMTKALDINQATLIELTKQATLWDVHKETVFLSTTPTRQHK